MEQPRIHGTELEWASEIDPANGQPLTTARFHSIMTAYGPSGIRRIGDHFSDGKRRYLDIGDHIETTTAESDSFEDTTASEIAEEAIIWHAFKAASQNNRRTIRSFAFWKRVISHDRAGKHHTWGAHESYDAPRAEIQIPRSEEKAWQSGALEPWGLHLATRDIFVGQGTVHFFQKTGWDFSISQKAWGVNADYSKDTTTGKKGVVNLRDESHCRASSEPPESQSRVRLHATKGDPNLSPWATPFKLATSSLVIRVMAHKIPLQDIALEKGDLVRLNYDAAHAPGKDIATTINGKSYRAIDIQEKLAQAARLLSTRVELPEEELFWLGEWERAIVDYKRDPLSLEDRADWAIKYIKLQEYMARHGYGWSHPKVYGMDVKFTEIDPRVTEKGPRSIITALRRGLWAKWMPPPELIEARRQGIPPASRATVRGAFIHKFAGSTGADATWDKLTVPGKTIWLPDRYAAHNAEVDALINEHTAELEELAS